ncbi:MAG: hypothetical protein Q9227_007514 [Pyrenula ochraceoflavens]
MSVNTDSPRDYLNQLLAPSVKQGMIEAFNKKPPNPIRFLGEFLIDTSLRLDPSQNSDISHYFQYDHSAPTPPPPPRSPVSAAAPSAPPPDAPPGSAQTQAPLDAATDAVEKHTMAATQQDQDHEMVDSMPDRAESAAISAARGPAQETKVSPLMATETVPQTEALVGATGDQTMESAE